MPYSYYPNESKTRLSGRAKTARDFLINANQGTSLMPYGGVAKAGASKSQALGGKVQAFGGKVAGGGLPDPGPGGLPKPRTGGYPSGGNVGGNGQSQGGKGKSGSFLDPFAKWPRKDAQSKGIKQSWHRRFKRKPGRRGAPAIAGKKIYALR